VEQKTLHIPFFPLNIFLLPGEQLPLHIFEERYQQLFREAEEEDIRFGLPFEDKDLSVKLVSVCRLVRTTKRYESGESDVIIEAMEIGLLEDYESVFPKKLYPGGVVRPKEFATLNEHPSPDLIKLFRDYVYLKYGTRPGIENVAHYRLVDLAASASLSNTDKVKLLMFPDAERQNEYLEQSIRYLNLLLQQEKSFENGFILN